MRGAGPPAADPDAYVAGLSGWQRGRVETLRSAVRRVPDVDEAIKWGHLVYLANGPAFLIRSEETRVLFGFWRGRRLLALEPRLKPGGKYEMATLELREDTVLDGALAEQLAREAVALNRSLGDPTILPPG
ncbi:MAG TPA: DUF1801 domain-containing protein [Allosphingosinicella sp.]|nr:DUF1801 domain-containing protein [Allosphingosinicella sp.]